MNSISSNNQSVQNNNYKTLRNGAITGIAAGTCDVLLTSSINKYKIKKSIENFKNLSFSEKRKSVEDLAKRGYSVQDLRKDAREIMKGPNIKSVINRSLLYGSILGTVGLLLDLKDKHNSKK